MFVLNNRSRMNTRIIYEDGNYNIVDKKETTKKVNGMGAFSENKDLVGIAMVDEEFFFIFNDKVTKFTPSEFKMEVKKISPGQNQFQAICGNDVLCSIIYVSYVSPEIIIGADIHEFDDLYELADCCGDSLDVESMNGYIECVNEMFI